MREPLTGSPFAVFASRLTHHEPSMSFEYWEQRYQTHDMPWEKGEPSPGLVDFLSSQRDLPGETVCVPGCGTGHDVREWAQAGFRAYGYDIAPSAIPLCVERTQ